MTSKQRPHLSQIPLNELQTLVSQATGKAFQESLKAGLTVTGMNDRGQMVRYYPDGQEELQGTLQ